MAVIRSARLAIGILSPAELVQQDAGPRDFYETVYTVPAGWIAIVRDVRVRYGPVAAFDEFAIEVATPSGVWAALAIGFLTDPTFERYWPFQMQQVLNPGDYITAYGWTEPFNYLISGALLPIVDS